MPTWSRLDWLDPDPTFGCPVGFSRDPAPHLGGLPALGANCAACHVGEITSGPGAAPLRVLERAQRVRENDAKLLTPPAARAKFFQNGSHVYDPSQMGYTDQGEYLLDTNSPGNSNMGHDCGTSLSSSQKRELIEYLKTL